VTAMGPVTVDSLLASATHALTQVESVLAGNDLRVERVQECKQYMDVVYGSSVVRTIALACAHGAEIDAQRALTQARDALRKSIEHLSEAKPS
jgi:hypothetical protein